MYTVITTSNPTEANTKLIIIPLLTDPSWLYTNRIYCLIIDLCPYFTYLFYVFYIFSHTSELITKM